MNAIYKDYGEFHLGIVKDNNDPLDIIKPKLGKNLDSDFNVEFKEFYVLTDCSFEISNGEIYRLMKPMYFTQEVTLTIIDGNQEEVIDFVTLLSKIDNKYYYVFPGMGRHLTVVSDNPVLDTGVYEIGNFYFGRGPALEMAELPIEI